MAERDEFEPGTHWLIDHFGGRALNESAPLREALIGAAEAAGATVLSCEMHEFGGEGGVTGVALLAESHISIHTWPERGLAAIDIFMCGDARPQLAAEHLETVLQPQSVTLVKVPRGQRNQ